MSLYREDEHRDSRYMDDDEYRRMRKAEDDTYEYHGDAVDQEENGAIPDENDGYPETVDHTDEEEKKPDIVYAQHGKGGVMLISPTSNLRWLPLFFALPEELVSKRPAYLEIPRHMKLLMKDKKYVDMVLDATTQGNQ